MSYHLKDFVNYSNQILDDNHIVLAYSGKDGHIYTTYAKAIRLGYIITGMEKQKCLIVECQYLLSY